MASIAHDFSMRPETVAMSADEGFRYLFPPEKAILDELVGSGLGEMSMLDLGVGAGRTTAHFQPLVRRYVGLDYSPPMLEACARRFPDGIPNGRFVLGDARDLQAFEPASFDFVLFSYNGLDSVDVSDREVALREVRKVLKDDGRFCFSTHNIDWRGLMSWSGVRNIAAQIRRPKALIPACIRQYTMRRENRTWSLKRRINEIRSRGSGIFFEGAVHQHYTTHEHQLAQLRRCGFDRIRAFSGNGIETNAAAELNTGFQIYYLARAAD